MKKKITKGYSTIEAQKEIGQYIDQSTVRLQRKLRVAWRKQEHSSRKLSYA